MLGGGEILLVLDKGLSDLSAAVRETTEEGLLHLVVEGLCMLVCLHGTS